MNDFFSCSLLGTVALVASCQHSGMESMNSVIYTYTNLNCYHSICPHQFYRRYLKKDLPFIETPAMKHGTAVHAAMEQRLVGQKPLPAHLRHHEEILVPLHGREIKAELKLATTAQGKPIDFWAKDRIFIRGKLDCVVMNNTRAWMLDWKTGKVREDPFELEIGAMLLQVNYPQITTIMGNYVWLAENKVGRGYDLSDTDATFEKCCVIANRIDNDAEFEKRQGPLCRWCDVMDCEYNRKQAA